MKKRTRRKVWPLVNPISYAMEGAAYAGQDALNRLRLLELAAIEDFAKGKATIYTWQTITDMLNLCEVMARKGIGPEALEACERAQAALVAASKRYEATKRMGTTGEGLQAFRDLFAYHDLQRQSVCKADYEKAIIATRNRIKSRAPEVLAL